MSLSHDAPCWYAIRTHARHEKLVRDRLAGQGIEQLLPLVKRVSQWKDRKKTIQWPLFPGYCFAKFARNERMRVLVVSGVAGIIGPEGRPEPIPEAEIEALMALMAGPLVYDAHPFLREGMRVEVIRGPLAGVQGILLRKADRCRLVIAVNVIKQAASVEIDAADVAPM